MNEPFENISNAFDSEFEPEKEIENVKIQSKELIDKSKSGLYNNEYIQQETIDLIEQGKKVSAILAQDLKIGANARQFEVYAGLMNSIFGGLKDLKDLNKTQIDTLIKQGELKDESENKNGVNVNVKMTGKDLLTMIENARNDNQLNAVEAEFKIEDEKGIEK